MRWSEKTYLLYRELLAKGRAALCLLLRIFPIDRKKIVFAAFEGDGGFCCNPRYLAEELHRRNPEYRMLWLTKDMTRPFPDYITPVKWGSFRALKALTTARVWIDNYRKPYGTLKRRGQLYLQTWHASLGFKAVGLFRGDAFPEIARRVSEWDAGLTDLVLSNSDYCDAVYPKKLLYTGSTLRSGSPRVDPLIRRREELRHRLRERLGLPKETRLLLYAPTFRGGNQRGKKEVIAETPSLDFARLGDGLKQAFGGEWVILLRLHPQLSAKLPEMPMEKASERVLDVSRMADISEILGGCDMLITDYSSCAFDAAFAGIPVLLYADDVAIYEKNRGRFMWKREELPFLIAETNEELEENLCRFDRKRYRESVANFMKKHGIREDGHASERAADWIEEAMRG